jgi:putative hydroxymethylpyrimidine transport system substrate-binding protein
VVPVDQLGVPTYDELVLVARKSAVEDDPVAIRAFLQALARGTDYARAHPQEAASAVLSAGKGLEPTQTRAEVAATLPLLAPPEGRPYGYMDENAWQAYAEWMAEHELISEAPPVSDLLTNELLP